MNTKDYWKIFNSDKSVVILTDVPSSYEDGVYRLMKSLQNIYGHELCSYQKFDERFDKIEDFNIILRTGYNLDGNRLLSAHLFEYDPKTQKVTVDRKRAWKIVEDREYVYSIKFSTMKCIDGWDGFRRHILWTMGDDSCWRFWGDAQFGKQELVPLQRISA